jgi:multicomponent Na+:H+ antiporter subunit G
MESVTAVGMVSGALAVVLAVTGCGFFLVGTLGLLRLPDFFTRAHAAAKCDAVGAGLILLAVALGVGNLPDAAKVLALAVLVVVASPTTAHALARAAWRTGLTPWRREPGS